MSYSSDSSQSFLGRLTVLRDLITVQSAEVALYQKQFDDTTMNLSAMVQANKIMDQAATLLQEVSAVSRERIKGQIESIVSQSIKDIFDDPALSFKIEFGSSHNKVTADFLVTKEIDGEIVSLDIMNECGGGLADVVSIALRFFMLISHSDRISKILILDECFPSISNFSQEVIEKLGTWLKSLCETYDVQLILITQKQTLAEMSNKLFVVEQDHKGIAGCKLLSAV